MIGIFECCMIALAATAHNWYSLAISATAVATFVPIMFNKGSIFLRKMAMSVYIALTILFAFGVTLSIVLISVGYGDMQSNYENFCRQHPDLYPHTYSKLQDCVTFVRILTISFFVIFLLLLLLLRLVFCRVLYYGMQEQVDE